MSGWSDLREELLDGIVHLLEDDPANIISFGAVCRSWRSSALSHRRQCRRRKTLIPWLLLPFRNLENQNDNTQIGTQKFHSRLAFYSLTQQKTYRIPLPLPQTAAAAAAAAADRFVGSSSDGFLISVDAVADLHVINPLSGAHFSLPPTSTLPGIAGVERNPSSGQITSYSFHYEAPPMDLSFMRRFYFRKATLLVSHQQQQQQQRPAVAAVIHGGCRWIAFAREGDASWTALDFSVVGGFELFNDIIFHRGRLYAISAKGTFAVDLTRPSDQPVRVSCTLGHTRDREERSLVESPDGDELFMATRIFKRADTFISEKKYTVTKVKLARFVVSKLDESGGKWKEVQGLGDYMFFLGSSSVCLLCESWHPYITRNCIYFSYNFQNGGQGLGVFDLGDETIKQVDLLVDRRQLAWSLPPLWFTPVLALQ